MLRRLERGRQTHRNRGARFRSRPRTNPHMVSSPASVIHSKIDAKHGQVDAHSPSVLKEAGNDAARCGDWTRATHMYTLALDMIVKGKASDDAADWYALDCESKGLAHVLCSNRSLSHLNSNDFASAAEDAEHACLARPDFVKAHLRLLAALKAGDAPLEERRAACARGLRACPRAQELIDVKMQLDAEAGDEPCEVAEDAKESASTLAKERLLREQQVAAAKLIADDESDRRRAMAAGDYGSALALGAHGVAKDLELAEHYLKIGADGGDAGACRNLGFLLLETPGSERAAEAAEYLRKGAELGDERAAEALEALHKEANQKREAALFKLRALAANGDARAKEMLEELQEEGK